MQKQTVIGCDIDEVIIPQVKEILKLYNARYGDNVKYEDITDYNIQTFLRPECEHLFEEFCNDEFIEGLRILPENVEYLTKLNNEYKLYFCTARHPFIMAATDRALEKRLDWYRSGQLIRVKDKHLLKLDYLIDDHIGNLIGGEYRKVLMSRPWNVKFGHIEGVDRVYSLKEAYELIRNEVAI